MTPAPTLAHPVIAVDGPAASGKGTLAKRLAAHYGFHHLDTGMIYRAVALKAMSGLDPIAAAHAFDPDWTRPDGGGAEELRSEAVGAEASVVAAIPEVREALIRFQRRFASLTPGAVLDGRDIGTAICPDAPAKLFVTAGVEVRAERRLKELRARGVNSIYAAVLQDLMDRDARDAGRSASPLKVADDAVMIDTTELDVEAAYRAALAVVSPRIVLAADA
jgi:CMP/dCMP kinase